MVDSHPLAKRQKPHYETPCACMEPNRVYPIISPLHACVIRSPRLYHCQRHSSSPVELDGRRSVERNTLCLLQLMIMYLPTVPTFHILSLENVVGNFILMCRGMDGSDNENANWPLSKTLLSATLPGDFFNIGSYTMFPCLSSMAWGPC